MPTPFDPIISENFNGGEVTAVEGVLLAPNQLQEAKNVRFKLGGGFTNRPGFFEKVMANFIGIGASGIQGMYSNDSEIYIAVNGKIFVAIEDVTDGFELLTGLNTTADVEFLTFQGDIYVMNGIDFPRRIARTIIATALIAAVSATVDVKSGQGWRFTNTGTIRVISLLGFDDITYTGKANDTLTLTAATVSFSHPVGSLIYQITTLSSAPKIGFGAEFLNTWWGAGNPGQTGQTYQGNTLFYSRGATGVNPEYFYDFAGGGAGYIPVGDKDDIMGLIKTKTYLLILKKTSIYYCSGFNSSAIPVIQPLTDSYGTNGKRSFAVVGDQIVTFTGKSIKEIGEKEGLNNSVPSIDPQFDDKIFNKLKALNEDQFDSVLHYNPDQKLMKLTAKRGSLDVGITLDTNISEKPWSEDTNKPMACAVNYKGETFWGSNSEPKIFQDEVGYSDNGVGIRSFVRLADFNAKSSRLSKYFKYQYLYGLLGENTIVTVKIYFDDVLVQQYTLTDSLITPAGGSPIGRILIGGGIGVSTENATLGYPFEIEKLLKKRRDTRKMSVEFIADGEGQVFEIKGQELNGYYSSKFDRKIRS